MEVVNSIIAFFVNHHDVMLALLLVASEGLALGVQLLFPDNKGVGGVLAGLVKALKALGAKKPQLPEQE